MAEESTTLEHIHFNPILNHIEKHAILNLKRNKIKGNIENSMCSEHNSGLNNFKLAYWDKGKKILPLPWTSQAMEKKGGY